MSGIRRFTTSDPCPICCGHPGLPRGEGVRCAGYIGSDGLYAHCTRDQHAGAIDPDDATPPTYAHRLEGECRCGLSHGAASAPAARTARRAPVNSGPPEAVYDYHNADGTVRYQVGRFPGKAFSQRLPQAAGWAGGLNGTARVLYGLPEILAASPSRHLFVVEGEKDVETLRAAGLVATTNSGGVDGWRPELAAPLKGRNVVVIPDNDGPGRKLAGRVALDAIAAGAREVRVLALPGLPEKGDVSDWLTAGRTIDELKELVLSTPPLPAIGTLLADVKAEPIEWLWTGYVALGMVTEVIGDPGLGKSTMTLDVAARVSTRRVMPDGSPGVRGGVVILSAEDHLAKVIRPRLDAIDADLSRIVALEVVPESDGDGERDVELPDDLGFVEQAINRVGAVLVIIDPFVAYLGGRIDSHRDQDVRRVLRRLKALAERTGVAILLIRHLNKAQGSNAAHRGGGSIGITAAVRGGLLVAPDPDVEGGVVMACSKASLAAKAPSRTFHIESAPNGAGKVRWDGTSEHTSASLLAAPQDGDGRSALRGATEFLKAALAAGPRPAEEVKDEATTQGISLSTLKRAREDLGVKSLREGVPGQRGAGTWRWLLAGQIIKGTKEPFKEDLVPLIDSEYESESGRDELGLLNSPPEEPNLGPCEHCGRPAVRAIGRIPTCDDSPCKSSALRLLLAGVTAR